MTYLEKFSEEEVDLLIAIPYRAGLWVSASDSTGGFGAQVDEIEALDEIMEAKAKSGMFESAFVHEIMVEAYSRKNDWHDWTEEINKVHQECHDAVIWISKKLSDRDVKAYGQNVMFIATEVAKAFREYDEEASSFQMFMTNIKIKIDTFIGLITGKEYESESLLNISYKEDLALAKLSQSLQLDNNEVSFDGTSVA